MNKVTTVNLNGNAYPLEEPGYDVLRAYLDAAARALANNPDRDEIIADIEQAIADKFRATLGAYRTVVAAADVKRIVEEMGPVDGGGGAEEARSAAAPPPAAEAPPPPKRLYIIREGAMVAGVCNGLAAYFGIDVSLVRVLFVVLSLAGGAAVLAYVLLLIILPTATTPEEKAAASGLPKTAQDFIHRAKQGYYEGMRTWGDRRAHREWRRKFREEMRGWKRQFKSQWREQTQEWHANWHRYWSERPRPAGPLALPLISLLCAIVGLVWALVVIGFLLHHRFLGIAAPAGMPFWAVLIVLLLAYSVIVAPLKAMRWSLRGPCWGPWAPGPFSVVWLLEAVLWLVVVAMGLAYLGRHQWSLEASIRDLGPALHHGADRIRDWWNGR